MVYTAKLTTLSMMAMMAIATVSEGTLADTRKSLGVFKKWDAFIETNNQNQKTCYMISIPRKTVTNQKISGRGDTYMMIKKKPAYGTAAEVMVVLGFTGKENVEAVARVDNKESTRMFVSGDAAWTYDTRDDVALVTQMKAGYTMLFTSTSKRGTVLKDTYDLSGFSAAYKTISDACQ